MGYLLAEIVLYLVGAGLIGFVFGWIVRGGMHSESVVIKEEKPTVEALEIEKKEAVPTLSDDDKPSFLSEPKEETPDKLSEIKGIGPVLEKKLNALGIYYFEQITAWTPKQEEWVSITLGFPKKVTREAWAKQAKELLEK
ncbi:MAG: Unknown protein [uncultured Sulfurovum sp.]|uniref:NADH-ubiquinone oxidoreductase chain E (EC) n=1 Tax=uncultured Sulfurovum sp. TaxID=269237 RepID=A0A6S6TVN9_9BACT|nr:MAG: Unknown protein [uncultured Sulfurovum sp.]